MDNLSEKIKEMQENINKNAEIIKSAEIDKMNAMDDIANIHKWATKIRDCITMGNSYDHVEWVEELIGPINDYSARVEKDRVIVGQLETLRRADLKHAKDLIKQATEANEEIRKRIRDYQIALERLTEKSND